MADYPINIEAVRALIEATEAKPTEAEMCAELARVMFPDAIEIYIGQFQSDTGVEICLPQPATTSGTRWVKFNPFTDAADKDALVAWLAEDDARWFVFIRKLIGLINWPAQSPQQTTDATFAKVVSDVRYLMTADCETIALAAWRAIQKT